MSSATIDILLCNPKDYSAKRVVTVIRNQCKKYLSSESTVRLKLAIKCVSKKSKEIKSYSLVIYSDNSDFLYRAPKHSGPCLSACIFGCNKRLMEDDN